jgi:hypothetical protein
MLRPVIAAENSFTQPWPEPHNFASLGNANDSDRRPDLGWRSFDLRIDQHLREAKWIGEGTSCRLQFSIGGLSDSQQVKTVTHRATVPWARITDGVDWISIATFASCKDYNFIDRHSVIYPKEHEMQRFSDLNYVLINNRFVLPHMLDSLTQRWGYRCNESRCYVFYQPSRFYNPGGSSLGVVIGWGIPYAPSNSEINFTSQCYFAYVPGGPVVSFHEAVGSDSDTSRGSDNCNSCAAQAGSAKAAGKSSNSDGPMEIDFNGHHASYHKRVTSDWIK